MTASLPEIFLSEARAEFQKLKSLADRALSQVSEAELFAKVDEESNSIAIIMTHIAGNMRSRWTDFLTSDGEKPDRNRDREFEIAEGDTRQALLQRWESGWQCLFGALDSLSPSDLERTIFIRSQPHSVVQAIHRQLTHYATHVGQIVLLAKHYSGAQWHTLSIPRGKSEEFNRAIPGKARSGQDL